jgi:N-methylhydantoinase B/oxoprolinase/acetone carboxylase alpha subunit/N-methylhydantoinase A/oxoprolinase/acetone carboxylase beta subunit
MIAPTSLATPTTAMASSGSEGGPGGWRFWIDRGGTFTDLVGQAPDGSLVVRKVLSERGRSARAAPPAERPALPGEEPPRASGDLPNPAHSIDPAVAAIREVLGLAAGQPLPEGLVAEVRLGTTVATNALLERRVEPVLLLVNRGFADLAAIGEQHRPDIFALQVERPPLLPYRVLEVPGRLAADGGEVEPFQRDSALEHRLRQARAEGLSSCAVALLHAVADPSHELAMGAWLEELGFAPVLLSHRVGGLPRLLPRLHTTLVEAAVRPVLQAYLAQVRQALGPSTRLRVMTSAGVLQPPDQLLAKDTVLSGPAGGLGGAVAVAHAAGLAGRPILGFDMGGTSTDVFHLEEGAGIELSPETVVAGLRLQAPTLPIHTLAAGGGSVVRLEGGRLQVGPESAGAVPGPACYRRGGPLTITDANLLLGRLPEGALPPVFGPGGDQPPDAAIVRRGFEALAAELVQGSVGPSAATGAEHQAAGGSDLAEGGLQPHARPEGPEAIVPGGEPRTVCGPEPMALSGAPSLLTPEALAQGARSIALERMADAIRRISIQRGHDIRTAVLVSYGGAGGQHACSLAERLGVERVLLHSLAGVLSAYGLGLSRQEALRNEAVQLGLQPALLSELRRRRDGLLAEASQALEQAGDGSGDRASALVSLELRPAGGERGLEVPWSDADSTGDLRTAFETRHRQRYGYVVEGEALVVERLQVLLPAGGGGPGDAGSGGAPSLRQEWAGAEEWAGVEEGAAGSGAVALGAERRAAAMGRAGRRGSQAPAAEFNGRVGAAASPPEPSHWVPLCLPDADAGQGSVGGLAWRPVPCWRREELRAGQRLVGPAVVLEATGTTVLEPGWGGRVLPDGALLLEPLTQGVPGGDVGAALQVSSDPYAQDGAGPYAQNGAGGRVAQSPDPAEVVDGGAYVAPGGSGRPFAAPDSLEPEVHSGYDPSGGQSGQSGQSSQPEPGQPDPVRLELYNHRFSAIAEQMGVRLQQSSRSVNIRERLDFSCALFDGDGRLVANAPHIPVHLGSMGESVAALLASIFRGERAPLVPGDAVASNDPYGGGTHLPDITVISPVFAPQAAAALVPAGAGCSEAVNPGSDTAASTPLFYVACRGHHADVGGITPGSMPPFSRSILEEGLRLDNVPLIQAGHLDLEAWRERLSEGHHPVRDPERLLADLQAQVAANRLGEAELHRLMAQQGAADVVAAMGDVQRNAAEAVRSVIDRLRPGRHAVELDDGSCIVVAIEPDHRQRRVRVDFSGTSPQQGGNLNAPLAITKAVVLYVFRVLVAQPIPLNAGCFEPIDLVVPLGCLLHPTFPAAVVGGNVETSQAVANALFGALGVLAAGQGTMNNLSFGNDRCQYYETVAGGSGAGMLADGSGFAGCSAVQSHMTNSRLTDPEILEARFPVQLERFARRRGSGGIGRWRGGDGVVRVLRALEPITLAILSGSRRVAPFGLAGGGEGRCGRNALLRSDGGCEELGGSAQVAMKPGDVFVLETPGGGGWGVEPAPAATAADREQGLERLNSGSEPCKSTVVLQSASPQAGAQH